MGSITVVIPTRNRRDLLSLTLKSILGQRDVDMRVVVVDDASDGGALPKWVQTDRNVELVRQPARAGPNAARNRGIAEAISEWIAFCDDDDLWAPDKLSRQLAAARDARSHWVYTGSVYVNAQLQVRGGSPPLPVEAMMAALPRFNALPAAASNVLVRADVLKSIGGFDLGLPHLADWELWLRLAGAGPPACVSAPLVAYRLHGTNFSFNTADMLAELETLERRNGLTADRSRFHRHLARMSLEASRRREALSHFARAALHVRDGYSRADAVSDGRLLVTYGAEVVRRRFRRSPSRRARRRQRLARERDIHAAWKAQAQAWLDQLPR
jgi:glycosyltransferase involved in cell wall biosynthesis